MGLCRKFQIKYKGRHPKEFHKLAKMIIPNSLIDFNFDYCQMTDDLVELDCTRNIGWRSVCADMKKLISYLPDGESIFIKIDGEMDCEEIYISKQEGNVTVQSSNDKGEEYISYGIGIPRILFLTISPSSKQDVLKIINNTKIIDICSLDGYIQLIANTFANEEQLMPIVQNFMYEILDKDKMNLLAYRDEDKISEEDCVMLDRIRAKFSSVESTAQFLQEHKKDDLSFELGDKLDFNSLPDWAKKYPKELIYNLGGVAFLKKLIDTMGEDEVKNILYWFDRGLVPKSIMGLNNSKDELDFNSLPDWAKKYSKKAIDDFGGVLLIKNLINMFGEDEARKIFEKCCRRGMIPKSSTEKNGSRGAYSLGRGKR